MAAFNFIHYGGYHLLICSAISAHYSCNSGRGNSTAYIGRRYDSNITKNCLKSIDSAAATWMQVMNYKNRAGIVC